MMRTSARASEKRDDFLSKLYAQAVVKRKG
jgi:hypothetical protein